MTLSRLSRDLVQVTLNRGHLAGARQRSANPVMLVRHRSSLCPPRVIRVSQAEFKGYQRLLQRSNLFPTSQQSRSFSVTSVLDEEKKDNKDKDETDPDKERERQMSNLKTLGFFIFVQCFIVFMLMGSSSSRSNGEGQTGGQGGQGQLQKVSWNDFYYNMLLAGEVQEVTVYSNVGRVKVTLRPDAIYKV